VDTLHKGLDMLFTDLKAECARIHKLNEKWWLDLDTLEPLPHRDRLEMFALINTEYGEAMEGYRKNKEDDKLKGYPMALVELVDANIRILDTLGGCPEFFEWVGDFEQSCYHDIKGHFAFEGKLFSSKLFEIVGLGLAGVYTAFSLRRNMRLTARALISTIAMTENLARHTWGQDALRNAYEAKVEYNKSRVDHSIEHRRSAEGKKV
jgi:hypothetical protein